MQVKLNTSSLYLTSCVYLFQLQKKIKMLEEPFAKAISLVDQASARGI